MTDTTHECPAPGCTVRVDFHRFCCAPHWYYVSAANRRRLLKEWRDNRGEDSYFEARAACLRDLGVRPADVPLLNGGMS